MRLNLEEIPNMVCSAVRRLLARGWAPEVLRRQVTAREFPFEGTCRCLAAGRELGQMIGERM